MATAVLDQNHNSNEKHSSLAIKNSSALVQQHLSSNEGNNKRSNQSTNNNNNKQVRKETNNAHKGSDNDKRVYEIPTRIPMAKPQKKQKTSENNLTQYSEDDISVSYETKEGYSPSEEGNELVSGNFGENITLAQPSVLTSCEEEEDDEEEITSPSSSSSKEEEENGNSNINNDDRTTKPSKNTKHMNSKESLSQSHSTGNAENPTDKPTTVNVLSHNSITNGGSGGIKNKTDIKPKKLSISQEAGMSLPVGRVRKYASEFIGKERILTNAAGVLITSQAEYLLLHLIEHAGKARTARDPTRKKIEIIDIKAALKNPLFIGLVENVMIPTGSSGVVSLPLTQKQKSFLKCKNTKKKKRQQESKTRSSNGSKKNTKKSNQTRNTKNRRNENSSEEEDEDEDEGEEEQQSVTVSPPPRPKRKTPKMPAKKKSPVTKKRPNPQRTPKKQPQRKKQRRS